MANKIPETGNMNKSSKSKKNKEKKKKKEGICQCICHSITLKQTKIPKQNPRTNLVPCTLKSRILFCNRTYSTALLAKSQRAEKCAEATHSPPLHTTVRRMLHFHSPCNPNTPNFKLMDLINLCFKPF